MTSNPRFLLQLHRSFFNRLRICLILVLLLSSFSGPVALAEGGEPPEEPRAARQLPDNPAIQAATTPTGSAGIATGDPNGAHPIYAWPFSVVQMGHLMSSYQNYGSTAADGYFHHGIDMIAPNGTDVYNYSGGQVVNVQNYTAGNDLYWEVAILDAQGYVWQYHHIDKNTIPQAIKDKYAAWQANPTTGGFIPAGTYIGDIVYWTVTSFGYRFNHIHLNILAAGDVYLDPLEFHVPLADTQAPVIETIGLLKSNAVVTGNTVSGDYGLYVKAYDLMLSSVFDLPPDKIEFALDGGAWTTVWDFHTFPGGANDYTYVNDFFVYPPTCGNYTCREFYIDLGFTTSGQRAFPSTPGSHTIQVRVSDYYGNSASSSFTWSVYKTYESTTSGSISDNGCTSGTGVTRTFSVTDSFTVADLNVGLNLSHASRGQLKVTLKAPGDTTATTIVNTASDTYDNYDVLLDDASTSAINDGSNDTVASPYYDRTAGPNPNASLDAFNGKSAQGAWTMFVCDGTSGTTGTVNRVKLDLLGTVNTNNPPTANGQAVSTNEDTPVAITLTASDPDGNPLTYQVTSGPAHGTLSGTAPSLTYTPAANYNGPDSFQFVANDGQVNSSAATVSLTVNAVNDAPVANAQAATTNEDTDRAITLTGSDVEGSSLAYSVVSGPAHGSLSGTAPSLTYTPAANYNGPDSFTFKVNDGTVDSAAAAVSLTVSPVNDAPAANGQAASTAEDTPQALTLTGTDIDSPSLTFSVTASPLHGSLSGAAPNLTYTPAADYNGPDSFQFVANDGQVGSAPATVAITVTPVNDAPTADAQSATTQQDAPVAITLAGADVDGDALTFSILSGPQHGALSGAAPDLTYTPEPGYIGEDGFTFTAGDGLLSSAPAAVALTVTRLNHAPEAQAQDLGTDEDTPVAITLAGVDPDGDPLTYTVTAGPDHGALNGAAPNLTYTPAADYNGPDSFQFIAHDGLAGSAPATVTITVNPVNDAPAANAQSAGLNEDGFVSLALTGSDPEGDALAYAIVDGPQHGALSGAAPDLTYTPEANYSGPDSFTFQVNDGQLDSAPAAVSLTVNPVNDPPSANGQSVTTAEDTPAAIVLSGADIDSGSLTYTAGSPAHGTLSGAAPNLTYTPAANYNGPDSFTFTVGDGQAVSAPATVAITVTPVNDAPTASPQSVTTQQDTAVAITLAGADADGDALAYSVVSGPANGALSGTAPSLTYTPASGYSGADSFTFQVSDGTAGSAAATVSITVNPSGPVTVFSDNFETNQGWTRNPAGTDTATLGLWERANPEATSSSGTKQMGTTTSGSYDLVTGPLAGGGAGDYDIDGGATTIRSPNIVLPAGRTLTLTLRYYLAHLNNSSSADYLRIKIVGATTTTLLQELGAANDDDAAWATLTANVSAYAGQTVYILIEAADASGASLVEAGIDDVTITAQ